MRVIVSFLLVLSTFLVHVFGHPHPQNKHGLLPREANSTFLPPPSQDPWFQPPTDWHLKPPGTVLKVRKSPYKYITIPNAIDTFQIQYRTTDTHNNASWAVSTQFIPSSHKNCTPSSFQNQTKNCAHAIVTYAVPYDSADPDATPSYLLQWGDPYGEISDLLSRGWIVSVPDYEGPLSSYCAGVQAGHAMLDSVRAILSVASDLGINTGSESAHAKVALWGYSGGAMATEFAAELAGSYAPELKLAGVVEGGTVPNITSVRRLMNGKDTAGLLVAGIVGITSQHADARSYLISRLKTEGVYNKTGFLDAEKMSGVQALIDYMYQDVYAYFEGGERDLEVEVLRKMYDDDAVMGWHGTPNMPLFIYKAIADEMSDVGETDRLVEGFCEKGANVLYHRNEIGGHNQELWQGRHRALDFLSVVLDGKSASETESGFVIEMPAEGCRMMNVTVAVNVTVVGGIIEVLPVNVTVEANGTVVWTPVKLVEEGVQRERNRLDVLGAFRFF